MPQKYQGLGTNGTCARGNDEAPGGQKPNRPEEYISFQTLYNYINKQRHSYSSAHTVEPMRQHYASIVFLFQYAGGVIGKLFFIIVVWKL